MDRIKIKSKQVYFSSQWLLKRVNDLKVVRSAEASEQWKQYNKAMDDVSEILKREIKRAINDQGDPKKTRIEALR